MSIYLRRSNSPSLLIKLHKFWLLCKFVPTVEDLFFLSILLDSFIGTLFWHRITRRHRPEQRGALWSFPKKIPTECSLSCSHWSPIQQLVWSSDSVGFIRQPPFYLPFPCSVCGQLKKFNSLNAEHSQQHSLHSRRNITYSIVCVSSELSGWIHSSPPLL